MTKDIFWIMINAFLIVIKLVTAVKIIPQIEMTNNAKPAFLDII